MSSSVSPQQSSPTTTMASPTQAPSTNRPINNNTTRANAQGSGPDQANRRSNVNTSTFKGATGDLGSSVFEMNGPSAQYSKTVEQLQLYVARVYKETPEIDTIFDLPPTQPTIPKPGDSPTPTGPLADGVATVTVFDNKFFEEQVKAHFKRVEALTANKRALYMVILGQCDQPLTSHIKGLADFADKKSNGDCIWLLNQVKRLTSRFGDANTYVHDAAHVALKAFYNLSQGNRSTAEYYLAFEDSLALLTNGNVLSPPPLGLNSDSTLIGSNNDETRQNLHEAQLAAHLILNADNKRFKRYKNDLRLGFSRSSLKWPRTRLEAYRALLREEAAVETESRNDNRTRDSTNSNANSNPNPQGRSSIRGNQFHQVASQSGPLAGDPYILLDTLASHSLFKDSSLVSNISTGPTVLELHTQAGLFSTNQTARFDGLPGCPLDIWYSSRAVANVLALRDVTPHCRVTMDTDTDNSLSVHCPSGPILKFGVLPNGLYGISASALDSKLTTSVIGYTLLQTVSSQKALFTKREIQAADRARTLSRLLGRPSTADFEHAITNNHLRNCPITVADVRRADILYGPDIATIKGRTTDHPAIAQHLAPAQLTPLPPHIALHHQHIVLCVDFFYVQGHAFLHAISRDIHFRHSLPVDDRSHATMLSFLQHVITIYQQRGFIVQAIHADSEFC